MVSIDSRVDLVLETKARCGECPRWSQRESLLYWVDIDGKTLNKLCPATGKNTSYATADRIGSFSFRRGGGLVCAAEQGFDLRDEQGNQHTILCEPALSIPGVRFNDGRCDPTGRFWAGTMDERYQSPIGSLYRLDGDNYPHEVATGAIVSTLR